MGSFPDCLKCANVRPIYQKMDSFDKRVLDQWAYYHFYQNFMKKMIYEQTSNYFEPFLNKILCGFRKTHSTQHASFALLTSWQPFLSRGGFVGSIIMDLSKAYDFLKNGLLLAILQAYGFSKNV